MKRIERIIILILVIILWTGNAFASTLNLGEDVYRLKLTNFSSNRGEFINLNLGYGLDEYSAYGVNLILPYGGNGRGIAEIEYQFIPEGMQKTGEVFNYAFKIGGVSGNIFDSSNAGVKGGFVIENDLDDKVIYFNSDLVYDSSILLMGELGVSGEISEGIEGVIGYKVVASDSKDYGTARGFFYGIKIDF
ncbi:hypothetical protein [Halonatronum saccharophilum]|uniref:hypothetical protein n=1 Tax=Halonatronum saccharophilum TaxID=150060 RepID=UPI000487B6C2|nr:hypothetical protein [Halonatronum saccharophilum]